MANFDLIGSLTPGFKLGSSLRRGFDDRKKQALGAQQREVLGGLRSRSLGLGGETSEQKHRALTEMAAISPEKTKELQSVIASLSAPRLASIKEDTRLMSQGAASVKGMAPEQRPAALQNLSQTFAANGHPKLAAGAAKMAQLGPEELDIALNNSQNLGRETEKIIASQEKASGVGAQADFAKGKEFITKDKDGNLILNTSVFNKRTGKQEIGRSPITEELVNTLGDTGDEESLRIIADAGGKTAASAKAALSVKAAQDAFEQVVTIDAGIRLLDEGIAELESGADVGILDKFLPSIKEASSRFDNVADRMGLQVVSSVTFGALSAGELKVAMDTAVPPNLDNKQLAKWFKDRKAAQTKLRKFYIDIAKQASEEGKTPAEIMVEIEDRNIAKNKGDQAAAIEWAKQNPNDPRAIKIMQRIGGK